MPMKIAFSTVACPDWDFAAVAARAAEYGYDGVELRGLPHRPDAATAEVLAIDAAAVRGVFADAKIAIACLAASIAFTQDKARDAASADDLRRLMDLAEKLGCGLIKIFDSEVRAGQTRSEVGARLADWLRPLGDDAAGRNLTLVIENALSFRNAKEMWQILELLDHPAVGACWDVFNAALAGETPWVSVPVLNNRIQYVQVKDARFSGAGATLCPLGEGDVRVENLIHRLRGIGYGGYITFEWERAWLANLAPAEEALPAAATTLKRWISGPAPLVKAKPVKKPAVAT